MSADEREPVERSLAARLRRRRASFEDDGDNTPAAEPEPSSSELVYKPPETDFGYGGWTITLDALRLPETRAVVSARSQSGDLRTRLRSRPITEGLAGREADDGALDVAPQPALPAPRRPVSPAGGGRPTRAPRPRREEDRPLIAPEDPVRDRGAEPPTERGRSGRRGARERLRQRVESPAREEGTGGIRKRRARRIEGGGTVIIDDVLYRLVDWSTGGIAIPSAGHAYRVGERRQLELEIDLDDYAVNLDLEGEVRNRTPERTGWQFLGPTEPQRQVLRALTSAALEGRAFDAPPSAPARGRRSPVVVGSRRDLARRLAPLAALVSVPFNVVVVALLAGAAILHIPGGGVPDFLAGVRAPAPVVRAEHAAVAVERVVLQAPQRATVAGWWKSPGETVGEGNPLAVLALPGDVDAATVVDSPCRCTLVRRLAEAGEEVAAGQELALLVPEGVSGHVEALFDPANAPRPGATVSVDMPDTGASYAGVVEVVGRPDANGATLGLPRGLLDAVPDGVLARIRTTPAVPAAAAGDPAVVTVRPRT